jgi:hypothetical protein
MLSWGRGKVIQLEDPFLYDVGHLSVRLIRDPESILVIYEKVPRGSDPWDKHHIRGQGTNWTSHRWQYILVRELRHWPSFWSRIGIHALWRG